MAFIPYTYADGQPTPWEYKQAAALGEIRPGQALVLSAGKLTKCSGDNRPEYIGMYGGDGRIRRRDPGNQGGRGDGV